MGNINIHNMASRYIARRYGETSSELTRRGTSMTREVRARSSSREPGQYNIRSRSYSPARASGQSQFSNNLQYYRPVQNESIHERDLFSNFVSSTSTSGTYSSGNMANFKDQFSTMVQDRWSRKQLEDPSVDHDFARKASAWSNYLSRGPRAASEVLGRKHSAARLVESNFSLPKIYVYHNSAC